MAIGNRLLIGGSPPVDPPTSDIILDFATGLPAGVTVTHTGNCLYRLAGGSFVQAAANTPRLDYTAQGAFRGLVIERAFTNKCLGENIDPVAATDWDTPSVPNIVDDSAELAAAGLDGLVASGNVLQATGLNHDNDAASGNTNPHSMCAFARVTPDAPVGKISLWNAFGEVNFDNAAYAVVRSDNITPLNDAAKMRMGVKEAFTGLGTLWLGGTYVEKDRAPVYPIPGVSATKGLETLNVAQSVVPDGTYDIWIDTEGGTSTLFSQTVANGWSFDGDDLDSLAPGQVHIKKITFTDPSAPPAPSVLRRPFGLYGTSDLSDAGDRNQFVLNLMTGNTRGYVHREPWYRVEPQKDVFDFSRIDQAIVDCQAKEQELGHDFGCGIFVGAQTFQNAQADPFTAGPPAYIVNNPAEYGGDGTVNPGGPGGMWRNVNNANWWRTSRHHPAFMARQENLVERMIDRYADNPTVRIIFVTETALGFRLVDSDFDQYGASRGYIDRTKERLTRLAAYGDGKIAIAQISNFYHYPVSTQQANYEVWRHCAEQNAVQGKEILHMATPDSIGNGTSQGYSGVYAGFQQAINEGYIVPWVPSIQWEQFIAIDNGEYTMRDTTDVAVKDFEDGSMQWGQTVTRGGADWNDIQNIYNNPPDQDYIDFNERQIGGPPVPPPSGYDADWVQHPAILDATYVNRTTAWTGQGAANQQQFTIAAAFEYQLSEGAIYTGNLNRFRFERLASGQHYIEAKNGATVTYRWNQGASGLVAGQRYLFVQSVDLTTASGVGFAYAMINIATGAVATAGSFPTWTQGEFMEVEQPPYNLWSRDTGGAYWPDETTYVAFWPGRFWNSGSIADAFYDSVNNELKDPIGSDVTDIIGLPRFLLEGPAANYESGSNRAVPGDGLTKQGTGTFTDVP